MDASIIEFIEQQTAATICCIDPEGNPYCFNAFYSFDKDKHCLYFKSALIGTHHGKIIERQSSVAGTILPDTLDKIMVKGIQFNGEVTKNDLFNVSAAMHYHTRHPMAMAVPGDMWTLHLSFIKFTDNSRGFGTKIVWQQEGS